MSFLSPNPKTIDSQKGIDTLRDWREEVFGKVIRVIGIAGTVVFVINMVLSYQSTKKEMLFLQTLSYLFVAIAAFMPHLKTVYRTHIFTSIVLFVGIFTAIDKATVGDGRIWLILAAFLATVFLGKKTGLIYASIATIAWALIGYLFSTSLLPYIKIDQFSFAIWTGTTLSLLITSVLIALTVNALSVHLSTNVDKRASLTKALESQKEELAKQRDALIRRSNALEASARVSRHLASATLREDIIKETPKLIQDEFEVSSAVFLLFDKENVLRRESSSRARNQAKNTRTSLSSKEKDLVNKSIADKQAYTQTDPDTEEESQVQLAIPIQRYEKMLGAILLKSDDLEAFGTEKISILQMLVDHIAILLENALLLVQKESALEAERHAYGEIAQGAWQEFIGKQEFGSYRRDKNGLRQVRTEAHMPQDTKAEVEAVPIRIRGKVIGHIDAQKQKNRAWTASEKELLNILTSRLETAIDSARLYQTAQERAERERIIATTSAKMRESLDIESVLKIAADELRKSLGIAEAEVWLSAEQAKELNTEERE